MGEKSTWEMVFHKKKGGAPKGKKGESSHEIVVGRNRILSEIRGGDYGSEDKRGREGNEGKLELKGGNRSICISEKRSSAGASKKGKSLFLRKGGGRREGEKGRKKTGLNIKEPGCVRQEGKARAG